MLLDNDSLMGYLSTSDLANLDVDKDKLMQYVKASLNALYRKSGKGSFTSRYMMTLSKFDRFGSLILPPNHEVSGYTFITRPMINLQEASLKTNRILPMLNTLDPSSIAFSIRCYLDSLFTNNYKNGYRTLAARCPFLNHESPFITPLSNLMLTIDGFPDYSIDTETTDTGFYNEDHTIARGCDFGNRTYDLNLTFRDIQGGYVFALMFFWIMYIALVTRGITIPYPRFMQARKLDYTCSIYRFLLDPSRKYITKWAKCTGCFPVNMPIGAMFNIAEKEHYLHSTESVSVTFKVNHVEYMDPMILKDFNTIVERFCPDVDTRTSAPIDGNYNFIGMPYIDLKNGMNEFLCKCYPEELEDTENLELAQLQKTLFGK